MQHRLFGNTKWQIPVIGQGTWYGDQDDRAAAVHALRRGMDLGMTHIDTAEMYLSGTAEEWVGQAISGRRDEVFLVSKVLPQNASRKGTVAACERSLARLGTDRLDCYLLHWRGGHPLEDTVVGFQRLRQQGKILSWGVSNFDVGDLQEILEVAPDDSFVCNQVLYHLQERAIEHAVLPWCEQHNTAVVAYSPFGHDDFPDLRTPQGQVLKQIADNRNATPRQVALRFLLRHPPVFVITKAASAGHVDENAAAGDLELTGAEIKDLDAAFPLGPRPASLPVL